MQVVRDLCLIATAEGHRSHKKLHVLRQISSDLDLPRGFVEQALASVVEPD